MGIARDCMEVTRDCMRMYKGGFADMKSSTQFTREIQLITLGILRILGILMPWIENP